MVIFGNFDKLNAPYYLVSDFLIPVQMAMCAAQHPKTCFTFQLSQNQTQPSTPNDEKCRCPKNHKWIVPCKSKVFCYDFEFCKMCHVHSTTQNQRYFYGIPDVTRYFGYHFWLKSCVICRGWNVLGDKKSAIFVQFWHIFRFCTKGKPF